MANIIGTNPAGETLSGTDDADFIVGLEGNDLLFGGAGVDFLFSGPGDDILDGGADGDFLFGDVGNDTLDGGAGDDMLIGGAGDDIYVVDATGDAVGEDFDAGIDLVQSSITYALGDNVENLTLTGAGNINGTGNDLANVITGNDGSNVLTGGAGNDTLVGGAGNDELNGGPGADVFRYSFNLTQGGGETFSFTQFFAENGGILTADGEEVADGTSQGQFSSLYTQWLEMLIQDQGLGTAVLDLGQNAGVSGTPVIENMTGEFGERESFTWTSGSAKKPVVHERWYSDTWTSDGGGQDVTSNDGLDTILDFTWGTDKLDFSGVTQQQFLDFFDVDFTLDVTGDLKTDTVITINGFDDWSITLSDFSGHGLADFANDSFFS